MESRSLRLRSWNRDQSCHLQEAFACLEAPKLPVAEAAGPRVLCLPMCPELEEQEVAAVCWAVRAFFES